MAPTMFLETMHSLAKRSDDDIGGIPKWALVILIMLGGGVGVVLFYGIFRFMTPEKQTVRAITAEQADYMRKVRERNLNNLMADIGQQRGPYRHRQSNRSYAEASTR